MIHAEVDVDEAGGRGKVLFERAIVEKLVAAQDDPGTDLVVIAGMAPAAGGVILEIEVIFAVELPLGPS